MLLFLYLSSGSTSSSMLEMEMCGTGLNTEPDPLEIMLSEPFQHSLLIMERSILANVFQPRLAAFRQLPVLTGKVKLSLLSFCQLQCVIYFFAEYIILMCLLFKTLTTQWSLSLRPRSRTRRMRRALQLQLWNISGFLAVSSPKDATLPAWPGTRRTR